MNSLSLYLHVPFCKAKCSYCDFYSRPDLSHLSFYEASLCRALEEWGSELKEKRVETVYFGGGTPSLLSPAGLERILSAVGKNFSLSEQAEITLEMNPESATKEILGAAREGGVNRISMGMQSCLDDELRLLGRLHSASDTAHAVERVRKSGFENISLDLMYALPNQTKSDFDQSLRACLDLEPRHISFYCLTLSQGVPLFSMADSLPSEEESREMYLLAHERLAEKGYEHYEISNAALPGYRSFHNQVYWQGGEYLGIGPGAHSFLNGRRFSMEESTEKFISSPSRDLILWEEERTKDDCLTEYVMLSLRQSEGLDLEKLRSLSDDPHCRKIAEKLAIYEKYGLCRKTATGYALTPEGFFVSNSLISQLI